MSCTLVTIIMPVYNAEAYINEAIESVIMQTYQNWELIIVNDGSTDNTESVILKFKDARIKVMKQVNSGASCARNKALKVSKGNFITFLDADDYLPKNSINARVNYLIDHQSIDVVDGLIEVKNNAMNEIIRVYMPYYEGLLFPRLMALDCRVFFGVCYMFKRSILNDTLFNENMTHAEDLLFYMEISNAHSVEYGYVDEPIYWYRSGHESAMTNLDQLEKGYISISKEIKNFNSSLSQRLIFRFKIMRIMFLSWLNQKKYLKAISSIRFFWLT